MHKLDEMRLDIKFSGKQEKFTCLILENTTSQVDMKIYPTGFFSLCANNMLNIYLSI